MIKKLIAFIFNYKKPLDKSIFKDKSTIEILLKYNFSPKFRSDYSIWWWSHDNVNLLHRSIPQVVASKAELIRRIEAMSELEKIMAGIYNTVDKNDQVK